MKKLFLLIALAVSFFGIVANVQTVGAAGGIPPWPVIYSGTITLGGAPAPDGLWIVGKMEGYTSVALEVKDGRMSGLAVGAPDQSYFGKTITFELRRDPALEEGSTVADQTDIFAKYPLPTLKKDFNLTFAAFPTPTPLPTATPTVTPVPTATPVATATPIAVGPIVYNGMLVASGGQVPDGAALTARVGNYSSAPVEVKNSQFISLIIDLDDPMYTGEEVTFYLDGIKARTTAKYEVGSTIRNIDLIFMDLPDVATSTPIPMPTTPPPPTVPVDSAPATPAPVPAKVAEVIPTNTPVPTQIPAPTPEPVVVVVTATPDPASIEELKDSGGCMAVKDVDPITGTANVLAMIGPLLLLGAFRGVKKFF